MRYLRAIAGLVLGALAGVFFDWGVMMLFFPTTSIDKGLGFIYLSAGIGGVLGSLVASRGRSRSAPEARP